MRKLFLSFIGALLYVSAVSSFGVQVSGLFQTSVPVASQSKRIREAALKQALAQVLVKLSGNSASVNLPTVQAALANPDTYLLSYSYQDGTLPNGYDSLFLNVKFDPKAMQQILENANQSLWGKNRPVVLVWLSYAKNNQTPQLLSANSHILLKDKLDHAAKLRGLPLLFPIMDLTDIQNVTVQTIAAKNIPVLQQASKRYGSDADLAVDLQQGAEGHWTATWTLIAEANSSTWQNTGIDLNTLLKKGIDEVTDSLAAKYGVLGNATSMAGQFQLTVINIQSLRDFAKVTEYLKNLLSVKKVELSQINPSALVYNIKVVGGEQALQRSLSLDHRLQPVTVVPSLDNAGTGLVYQWTS